MTGMASNNAGKVVRKSQENAGKSIMVVKSAVRTIRKMIPRNKTMACVSRIKYSKPKNTTVTSRISKALNQSNLWKTK